MLAFYFCLTYIPSHRNEEQQRKKNKVQIILKHLKNNSDHGEMLDVEVFDIDWEDGKEIIVTDKGTFSRSVKHEISSPFGYTRVEAN